MEKSDETKMGEIQEIGACKGCGKSAILLDGVCGECLHSPNRGSRWAALAHKIRENPALAMNVYGRMKTKPAKKVFLFLFSDSMEKNGVDTSFLRAQIERAG